MYKNKYITKYNERLVYLLIFLFFILSLLLRAEASDSKLEGVYKSKIKNEVKILPKLYPKPIEPTNPTEEINNNRENQIIGINKVDTETSTVNKYNNEEKKKDHSELTIGINDKKDDRPISSLPFKKRKINRIDTSITFSDAPLEKKGKVEIENEDDKKKEMSVCEEPSTSDLVIHTSRNMKKLRSGMQNVIDAKNREKLSVNINIPYLIKCNENNLLLTGSEIPSNIPDSLIHIINQIWEGTNMYKETKKENIKILKERIIEIFDNNISFESMVQAQLTNHKDSLHYIIEYLDSTSRMEQTNCPFSFIKSYEILLFFIDIFRLFESKTLKAETQNIRRKILHKKKILNNLKKETEKNFFELIDEEPRRTICRLKINETSDTTIKLIELIKPILLVEPKTEEEIKSFNIHESMKFIYRQFIRIYDALVYMSSVCSNMEGCSKIQIIDIITFRIKKNLFCEINKLVFASKVMQNQLKEYIQSVLPNERIVNLYLLKYIGKMLLQRLMIATQNFTEDITLKHIFKQTMLWFDKTLKHTSSTENTININEIIEIMERNSNCIFLFMLLTRLKICNHFAMIMRNRTKEYLCVLNTCLKSKNIDNEEETLNKALRNFRKINVITSAVINFIHHCKRAEENFKFTVDCLDLEEKINNKRKQLTKLRDVLQISKDEKSMSTPIISQSMLERRKLYKESLEIFDDFYIRNKL